MRDYPLVSSWNPYAQDVLVAMFLIPLLVLFIPGRLRAKCNRAATVFGGIFLVWLGIQASNVYSEYSFVKNGGSFQTDSNGVWAFSGPQHLPYTDQDYPAAQAPPPDYRGTNPNFISSPVKLQISTAKAAPKKK